MERQPHKSQRLYTVVHSEAIKNHAEEKYWQHQKKSGITKLKKKSQLQIMHSIISTR